MCVASTWQRGQFFLSILLQFWEGSLRAEVLSCNSLYEVVCVVCLSPGLQRGKQTNYATDKPRHANDLVNAKSDAREKPLLADIGKTIGRLLSSASSQMKKRFDHITIC